MLAEIREQPEFVEAVTRRGEEYREVCEAVREARFVIYAARGTSDNAAVYGTYLAGIVGGLPTGLATPSAVTLYGARIDLKGSLVIGISQSGETPDVAEYLEAAGRSGATTVAITNALDSPLARASRFALLAEAGEERAVPATKTYTAQLAVLAMFWATWAGREDLLDGMVLRLAGALREALRLEDRVIELSTRYRFADRMLSVSRGFNFATALEAALKLQETSRLAMAPYSAADLMHGPIAAVEDHLPALVFGVPGPAYQGMLEVTDALRERGAEPAVIGEGEELLGRGAVALRLPGGIPEELSPLVAILPAQLLAHHLALAKGLDPDRPGGLEKVTRF